MSFNYFNNLVLLSTFPSYIDLYIQEPSPTLPNTLMTGETQDNNRTKDYPSTKMITKKIPDFIKPCNDFPISKPILFF